MWHWLIYKLKRWLGFHRRQRQKEARRESQLRSLEAAANGYRTATPGDDGRIHMRPPRLTRLSAREDHVTIVWSEVHDPHSFNPVHDVLTEINMVIRKQGSKYVLKSKTTGKTLGTPRSNPRHLDPADSTPELAPLRTASHTSNAVRLSTCVPSVSITHTPKRK